MVEVASLDEVPLREVWRDEAREFTPWLAANPGLLGKELQMDLELEGKEVPVGTFSADLVLRDTSTGPTSTDTSSAAGLRLCNGYVVSPGVH